MNKLSRFRSLMHRSTLVLVTLCAAGGAYETMRESMDRKAHPASAPLTDVGGHAMYLSCTGSGSPTVVLESGLGESSAYWGLIAPQVARSTRVCAYDRAGRGWSESAAGPRDASTIAMDLHTLLDRAHVAGPYVLVGHSSGAQYVRVFAGQYPDLVAGVVLLDAQPAEAFTRLPNYPSFYWIYRRVSVLFPALARMGIARLVYHAASFGDLPEAAQDIERFNFSSTRQAESQKDEFAELPTALAQAHAVQSLGARPLYVVTAVRDAQPGWLAAQDDLAALSTNSAHLVLPDITHMALIEEKRGAEASSRAIRDVVDSVRHGGTSLRNVEGASRVSKIGGAA